jgi:plasmid maintenance system antidote protein VapI
MNNSHVGSRFDDVLEEEQIAEAVTTEAILEVVAWLLAEEMDKSGLSKTAMARRMGTSRAQLDRALKGDTPNIGVDTLARAARAVDRELVLLLK